MDNKILKAKISKKRKLSPLMLLITLEPEEKIIFDAGQHIVLHIPTKNGLAERPFSIASAPHQHIELIVKVIKGGLASEYLDGLSEGNEIMFSGPKGTFLFAGHDNPVNFITTCGGLAPLRSMIHDIINKQAHTHLLNIILGAQDQDEIILEDELSQIAHENDFFKYSIVNNNTSNYAESYIARILHINESDNYICGGQSFILDIKNALLNQGVKDEKIHYERY